MTIPTEDQLTEPVAPQAIVRRRLLFVSLAVAVAVVVLVSFLVLRPGRPRSAQLATEDPGPATTVAAAPTTAVPVTGPTTLPALSTSTTATVSLPVAPKVFAATVESLTIEVTIEPGGAPTAGILTFSTVLTDAAGGVLGLAENFGDTERRTGIDAAIDCAAGSKPSRAESRKTFSTQHAYRKAGVYTINFEAFSGDCGRQPRRARVNGLVTISAGPVLSNGPLSPTIGGIQTPPRDYESGGIHDDPSLVYLSYEANDTDGYVTQLKLDWGDGTPAVVVSYPLSECHDSPTRWPGSTRREGTSHKYATSGAHTVTITATSTGCDGRNPQTSSTVVNVTAP